MAHDPRAAARTSEFSLPHSRGLSASMRLLGTCVDTRSVPLGILLPKGSLVECEGGNMGRRMVATLLCGVVLALGVPASAVMWANWAKKQALTTSDKNGLDYVY